ncbi:MAG: hypothetical protein LBI33_05890, partial [Propionibacteriaceae bacterium]|nr:hypothetical protein [Propionibacteriaceae bacterium]
MNVEGQSDHSLLSAARQGSRSAAEELWRRHAAYGQAVAAGLAPDEDWDAANTRAWTHILRPDNDEDAAGGFRPYLYLVIRAVSSAEVTDKADSFLAPAYASLPADRQEVLWDAHIESMKPAQIALTTGLEEHEATARLRRARQELRQEWANRHAAQVPPRSTCHWVWENSRALVRNTLSDGDHQRAATHIRICSRCKSADSDVIAVARHLPGTVLPTITGPGGAKNLLAYIRTAGPAVRSALALPVALPDGPTEVPAKPAERPARTAPAHHQPPAETVTATPEPSPPTSATRLHRRLIVAGIAIVIVILAAVGLIRLT